MDGYPNGWRPRYAAYEVTKERTRGGIVQIHVPRRTPDEEAAFLDGVDAAIRAYCPAWRLKRGKAKAVV